MKALRLIAQDFPQKIHELYAQDVDPAEANILAVVQKPINQSINSEISGPPAWKQLPSCTSGAAFGWMEFLVVIDIHPILRIVHKQTLYSELLNSGFLFSSQAKAHLQEDMSQISRLVLNSNL